MTENVPQKFTITKRFGRKVTENYQSYDFSTEMTTEVVVSSSKELIEAGDKLFVQCKYLTEKDIEKVLTPDQGE